MLNPKLFPLLIFLFFSNLIFASQIDTVSIKMHLNNIINTEKPRNYKNLESLNFVADYIFNEFKKHSDNVFYQVYKVGNTEYKNVICVLGDTTKETIVVGAHYDVYGNQDGADDNASGVVGLLELAKALKDEKINYRIELVAYTLEEPPFFRTESMGSFIHAKALKEDNTAVFGMISLEMIGYYDEQKKTQNYPIGILSLIYGNRANYITLVSKMKKGKFVRKFNKQFKRQKLIRTKKFAAPASLPGIDFSDHLNYWTFGFNALMITDTSFYRNDNYHETSDKIKTLDILKMSQVIESVYNTLTELK